MLVNYYDQTTGFTEEINAEEGVTVKDFLQSQSPSMNLSNYDIRVNRDVVNPDYVLNEGDKVICIPRNQKGA